VVFREQKVTQVYLDEMVVLVYRVSKATVVSTDIQVCQAPKVRPVYRVYRVQ